MEAELRQWGGRLDNLVAMADVVGTEAGSTIASALMSRARYKVAQAKLAKLKAAGSGKWESCRGGVENAWSDLETAFKRLTTEGEGHDPGGRKNEPR